MAKVQGNSKRAEHLIRRIEVAIHNDMNTAEAIADSEAAQEAKRRRLD